MGALLLARLVPARPVQVLGDDVTRPRRSRCPAVRFPLRISASEGFEMMIVAPPRSGNVQLGISRVERQPTSCDDLDDHVRPQAAVLG